MLTEIVTPSELKDKNTQSPVFFIDNRTNSTDKIADIKSQRVEQVLYETLAESIQKYSGIGQTLVKVHIGEPECSTRLRPEYVAGTAPLLKDKGACGVAAGDTTVAYTGERGHAQNPPGNCTRYLQLAHKHGWGEQSVSGMPFVVLDRPETSVPGSLQFKHQTVPAEVKGSARYKKVFKAGGFDAADTVVHHAHLTLHGLAGLAGCVKGIAMGCSGLKGKYAMHQSMVPVFDADSCQKCGMCVRDCPENAIVLAEGADSPYVDPEMCVGCGECIAVCPYNAVDFHGKEITDWVRGKDTLPKRMVDYMAAMMNGKWMNTIHILHMYNVTRKCDCVNIDQVPMISKDLGFLIGTNPFAVDLIASRLLAEQCVAEGVDVDPSVLDVAQESADYANYTYGIYSDIPVEKQAL